MRAIELDRNSPGQDWRMLLLFALVDTFMQYDAPLQPGAQATIWPIPSLRTRLR